MRFASSPASPQIANARKLSTSESDVRFPLAWASLRNRSWISADRCCQLGFIWTSRPIVYHGRVHRSPVTEPADGLKVNASGNSQPHSERLVSRNPHSPVSFG